MYVLHPLFFINEAIYDFNGFYILVSFKRRNIIKLKEKYYKVFLDFGGYICYIESAKQIDYFHGESLCFYFGKNTGSVSIRLFS